MRARTLIDRAMDAILDLLQASPHMRRTARYDVRELKAYHEGYYAALVMALRVLEEAKHVDAHARETARRVERQKKSA